VAVGYGPEGPEAYHDLNVQEVDLALFRNIPAFEVSVVGIDLATKTSFANDALEVLDLHLPDHASMRMLSDLIVGSKMIKDLDICAA
jgi:hypothetical protein